MSIETIIGKTVSRWMEGKGDFSDVVISSRIRLARNLEGYPFPNVLSESVAGEVITAVQDAVAKISHEPGPLEFFNLASLSALERFILVEKHLISPIHAESPVGRSVLLKEDQSVSIMVNEEDHLRIQCILPGLNLNDAWSFASQIDDLLEDTLNISYSEILGYLTACPTNVGTGLRASAMVHLPGLVLTHQVNLVLGLLPQLGLAVRGLYGEGSEIIGNLFQVSNQVTIGKTEEDILSNISAVVSQIVDREREARQAMLSEAKDQLEDKVWRAFGTLANARMMPAHEALTLLSDLRLGMDLGIITCPQPEVYNELIVITSPAYLQYLTGREMSAAALDVERAKLIRSRLCL